MKGLRGSVLGTMGGLLLVAGLIGWFYWSHERVEVRVEEEMQGVVRRDNYLLMKRYLEALGVGVDEPHRLVAQDFEGLQLAILELEALEVYPWARETLRGWVQEGGHLVLVISGEEVARGAAILEAFQVREGEAVGLEPREYAFEFLVERRETYLPEGADMGFDIRNDHKPQAAPLAVSAPRGRGRLTVVQDGQALSNDVLMASGEGGQFLADLLSMNQSWPERGLIYLQPGAPRWLKRTAKRGWPALVALFLLLLAGVSRGRRLGRIIRLRERAQAQRAEHVEATGRFLWHHAGGEVLVEATQRALLDRLTRRRPPTRLMSLSEKARLLAREIGEDEGEVRRRLGELGAAQSEESFQQAIQDLEELRRRL